MIPTPCPIEINSSIFALKTWGVTTGMSFSRNCAPYIVENLQVLFTGHILVKFNGYVSKSDEAIMNAISEHSGKCTPVTVQL